MKFFSDDSGISLLAFLFRNNLHLQDNPVTFKMVKVITGLDPCQVSGLDCIPVKVLRNSNPQTSYMLVDPFSVCLK